MRSARSGAPRAIRRWRRRGSGSPTATARHAVIVRRLITAYDFGPRRGTTGQPLVRGGLAEHYRDQHDQGAEQLEQVQPLLEDDPAEHGGDHGIE